MTVIAYDGHTLAADSQLNYGTTRLKCDKLFELPDGGIVGLAGSAAKCSRLLRYMREGGPIPKRLLNTHAIRVNADGTVDLYAESIEPERITSRVIAIGCGGDFAMGCMVSGKTSAEAVALTIEHDSQCGPPVVTLRPRSGLEQLAD